MKWVVAGFVVAIDRDALETVDGPPCGADQSHSFIVEREKCGGYNFVIKRSVWDIVRVTMQRLLSRACYILYTRGS